jgi:transposase
MFQPLTDAQWAKIEPLLPAPPPRKMNQGRPRANARKVLDAILWVLRTGASWDDLPKEERFVASKQRTGTCRIGWTTAHSRRSSAPLLKKPI